VEPVDPAAEPSYAHVSDDEGDEANEEPAVEPVDPAAEPSYAHVSDDEGDEAEEEPAAGSSGLVALDPRPAEPEKRRRSVPPPVNMNSDYTGISFYARCVFQYRKEEKIRFKTSIWSYLKFFLTEEEREVYGNVKNTSIHLTSGYRRIYEIFLNQIKALYGKKCIQSKERSKTVFFRLEKVYNEEDNDFVMPWQSATFKTYKELADQVIGFGNLAFTRTLWPEILPSLPNVDIYCHTGVTLLRKDREVELVDVNKTGGNIIRMNRRNVREMMNEEKTKLFLTIDAWAAEEP